MKEFSEYFTLRNVLILIAVLLFIFIILQASGVLKKNCDEDLNCFDMYAKACNPAKVLTIKNNNLYEYKINGKKGGDLCSVSISVVKMNPDVGLETREQFEGKSMKCLVPIEEMSHKSINEMENTLSYCTGELKEVIYETIIGRMYSYFLKNIDVFVEKLNETMVTQI